MPLPVMEPLTTESPSTTVDSLLASLKMDTRIQALQYKAITLQHTLRKMTARPDLKAATTQPLPPPVVASAPPPSPVGVVRSSLLDEEDDDEYDYDDDYEDDDDDDAASNAYYSLYDDYDDEDIEFETALPAPIVKLCPVHYMTVTRITTGPRLIDVPKTPGLSPSSSTSSSPLRSASSLSSLPQPRSSTSSYGSWTSGTTLSTSKQASRNTSVSYADWTMDSSKPVSSTSPTTPTRSRHDSGFQLRRAKHVRGRSIVAMYLENLGK